MQIKVVFLANAAILLEYKGLKILIDGIYDYHGNAFSNLSSEQWGALCGGKNEFSNITYLIFTHTHFDHFSAEKLAEYLYLQKPKGIIIPKGAISEESSLKNCLKDNTVPSLLLEENACKNMMLNLDKRIWIKVFPMKHLDVGESGLQHFCVLLHIDGKNIFITGDVDFSTESFELLKEHILDAVFVNPLFYLSKEGKSHFQNGFLQTKKQIVYHIPFAEDDEMEIRRIIEKEQSKQTEDTLFLMERGQIFHL